MSKLFFLAIPLLASGLCIGGLSNAHGAQAASDSDGSEIAEYAEYNTVFEVPTKKKDNKTYSSVVERPDGSATNETSVRLDQIGTYKVHYTLNDNGKNYALDYSFIVKNQHFMFTGLNSYAKFETSERTYGQTGLYVALANGETMIFNETINLKGAKKSDKIISFFAAPTDIGKTDFMNVEMYLRDVSDENNFLRTRFKGSQEGINAPYTYIDTGGNKQDMVGVERGTIYHTNSNFGAPINHSFYGYYPSSPCGSHQCNVAYDENENALYTNSGVTVIADYDSSTFYSTFWDGFKTGETRLTLTAGGYTADLAKFVITSVKDMDLSQSVIEDKKGPTITVDNPYEVMPKASVGNKYPVFDATATDLMSGDCDVRKNAYYIKGNKRIDLTITDGYFDIDYSGTYNIEYTATDKVGNTSKETLVVETSDSIPDIVVVPKTQIVSNVTQGLRYTLPSFRIAGGSGNYQDEYVVTYGGQPVEIKDNTFLPTQIGLYDVKYTVKDIRLVEKSYTFTVSSLYNPFPAFDGDPLLQKYFIGGYNNHIPSFYATDYTNGGTPVLANVEVIDGSGSRTIESGTDITLNPTNNMDDVVLKYKAGETVKEYKVPCVKAFEGRYLTLATYFVTNNMSVDTSSNVRGKTTATSEGDVSWEFANPLPAQNASVGIGLSSLDATYSAMEITFQDQFNNNQKATMRIERDPTNKIVAKVNNTLLKTDILFVGNDSFKVSLDSSELSFNKSVATITNYDNGELFNGFDSMKVYVSVKLINAKVGSAFYVEQICNQTINNASTDRNEPIITVLDNYGGYGSIGQLQQTVRVTSTDVLDPKSVSSLSVIAPNRQTAVSRDGTVLRDLPTDVRYTFVTSEYGQYVVTYTAVDTRGNEAGFSYSVGVLDDEAPVIKLTSSYDKSVKVGESIIIPTYEVIDNYDEAPKSYVNIISPSGIYYTITGKCNSLRTHQAGIFTVSIVALDSAGNTSRFVYDVTVR